MSNRNKVRILVLLTLLACISTYQIVKDIPEKITEKGSGRVICRMYQDDPIILLVGIETPDGREIQATTQISKYLSIRVGKYVRYEKVSQLNRTFYRVVHVLSPKETRNLLDNQLK